MIAPTMVTGGPVVMPRGVSAPVFETNPIAFGLPVAGGTPLVMDFATSSILHGDLRNARNAGRRVPAGTGQVPIVLDPHRGTDRFGNRVRALWRCCATWTCPRGTTAIGAA